MNKSICNFDEEQLLLGSEISNYKDLKIPVKRLPKILGFPGNLITNNNSEQSTFSSKWPL